MKYTTLENLKGFLWITDDSQDVELQKIIDRETKKFDTLFGWNLGSAEYIEYVEWPNKLFLLRRNIRNVEIWDESGNDISGEVKTIKWRRVILRGAIYGEIKVKYTAWWDDLEDIWEIEWVFLKSCKESFLESGSEENLKVKSERVDGISISYYSKWEIEKDTKSVYGKSTIDIVNRYKLFSLNRALKWVY